MMMTRRFKLPESGDGEEPAARSRHRIGRGLEQRTKNKGYQWPDAHFGVGQVAGKPHRGTLVDKAMRDKGGAGHEGLVHAVCSDFKPKPIHESWQLPLDCVQAYRSI